MRENRTHGSEGGESGSTGLPYPYCAIAATRLVSPRPAFLTVRIAAKRRQHLAAGVSPQNRCPKWTHSREAVTANSPGRKPKEFEPTTRLPNSASSKLTLRVGIGTPRLKLDATLARELVSGLSLQMSQVSSDGHRPQVGRGSPQSSDSSHRSEAPPR